MTKLSKELLEKTIERAIKKGAQEADAIGLAGTSLSLSSQNLQIDKCHVSSAQMLGIRTISNQKVGISYTETFDEDSLEFMIEAALTNATYADIDPNQQISTPENTIVQDDPELFQKDSHSLEDKQNFAINLEKKVKDKDSSVASVPYNGYGESEVYKHYLNHLGAYGYHQDRSYGCYTSALIRKGDVSSMFSGSSHSRNYEGLDANHCINRAYSYADGLVAAKPVATGHYDVIFSTDCLGQVIGAFLSLFSAKAAMEGKNPWMEKLGEVVAAKRISLCDDPFYKPGFLASKFDDEGRVRQKVDLIKSGKLINFYQNSATAKYFGNESNGHGSRSPKGQLGIGSTHIVIEPQPWNDANMTSGRYLEIIELKGFHSGTDPISGNFSLAAQGKLCQENETTQWVKDITISGTFADLLQSVISIGDQTLGNQSKTFFSPKIRFEKLTVSG